MWTVLIVIALIILGALAACTRVGYTSELKEATIGEWFTDLFAIEYAREDRWSFRVSLGLFWPIAFFASIAVSLYAFLGTNA